MGERGARYPHVHFGGSGFAQQVHYAPGGRAPDYGVVYENHAFALDDAAHGRQLQLYSHFPEGLGRHYEGPSHILALDQSHFVRYAADFAVTHCCAET